MQACSDEDLLMLEAPTAPGSAPFTFSRFSEPEKASLPPPSDFVPGNDSDYDIDDGSLPQFQLRLHHPDRAAGSQVDELRQFKALCDRLLPGLRIHSHLYTLIHLDDRTHTVTLSEWGEVIGGATFRLIQATAAPCLVLEVLLLAVEQRAGVCGRGHGTRIVNYLKTLALRVARRRKLAAAMVAQSDWQAGPGGGAARQFWVRQRLRATPQAMLLTRALFQWDPANEVYANAVPMLCWLPPSGKTSTCATHVSERAQQQASVAAPQHEKYRHTRHTRRVTVRMRGALTLLPPIEAEPPSDRVLFGEESELAHSSVSDSGGSRRRGVAASSRRPVVWLPAPPLPPACVVCGVRDEVDEETAGTAGSADGGRNSSPAKQSARPNDKKETKPGVRTSSALSTGRRRSASRRGAHSVSSERVRECRCCSQVMHESCDADRANLPGKVVLSAAQAQREAAEIAAALHLGLPAAADPETEFTCGHCIKLIGAGCVGVGNAGGGAGATHEVTVAVGEDRACSGAILSRVCNASIEFHRLKTRADAIAAVRRRFAKVRCRLRGQGTIVKPAPDRAHGNMLSRAFTLSPRAPPTSPSRASAASPSRASAASPSRASAASPSRASAASPSRPALPSSRGVTCPRSAASSSLAAAVAAAAAWSASRQGSSKAHGGKASSGRGSKGTVGSSLRRTASDSPMQSPPPMLGRRVASLPGPADGSPTSQRKRMADELRGETVANGGKRSCK